MASMDRMVHNTFFMKNPPIVWALQAGESQLRGRAGGTLSRHRIFTTTHVA
jgi:hypothetical protein